MKSSERDEKLIAIWKRLDGMWFHHQDGSDLVPVPKRFKDAFSPEYQEYRKKWGNESMVFDIIFNEVLHDIESLISKNRHKDLK
jgi:hypothetical protein